MERAKRIAEDVAEKLELGPEDDLLDVGCGSGALLSFLRPKCQFAVGVDFSSEQIALGRCCFPELFLVVGFAEHLDFQEGRFSRLLCYSVWHYVENWRKTLDRFLRVIRRPGIILIGDVPSVHHRWRLYFNYARSLPRFLLRPREFLKKLGFLFRAVPWHWVNLSQTIEYLENRGCSVEILEQPRGTRQHGGITNIYRFDMKVRVPSWR
jgi:ubiquinone/menaquinone biosynthesis C-methylase UbiE